MTRIKIVYAAMGDPVEGFSSNNVTNVEAEVK